MPDIPEERTYKHQVSAKLVFEAILAPNTYWEKGNEKGKKFITNGIHRGTIDELKKVVPDLEIYNPKNWKDLYTVFNNVEIKNDETIQLLNIQRLLPHVILLKSKWNTVELKKCTLENKNEEQKELTNFYLFDSATGNFEINDSTTGNFSIRDNSITGYFYIHNSTTGYFNIRDNSSTGYFSIRDNSSTGYFSIWENSTTDYFDIYYSTTGYFDIYYSKTGYFSISNSKTEYFSVLENSTTGFFNMDNSESTIWKIDGVQASFYFSKVIIGQCQLNNCDISKLTLKNECEMELYVSGGAVNLIDFEQLSLGKNTILSFSKIALYACNMNEFSALGNLYFRSIKKALEPYPFTDIEKYLCDKPKGNFLKKLYQNKERLLSEQKHDYEEDLKRWKAELKISEPTFRIVQSSLGKTEFTECDLGAFRFEYNNSKLTETFISGGTLPEKVIIQDEAEMPNILEQQKAFFNQLKKVFDNQGDIVRSNFFQAKAAEKQTLISIRNFRLFEFLVYFFNLISNNHGRSWFVALIFVVAVSHIGFYFYNGALTNSIYSFKWGNTEYLGDLAKFILPTHKFNFLGFNPNSKAVTIDFISRLFISYGIYQFISAFRKHGKRA